MFTRGIGRTLVSEALGAKLNLVSKSVFCWMVHGKKRGLDPPYFVHSLTTGSGGSRYKTS